MTSLQVHRTRAGVVESRHRVAVAVWHVDRGLVARSGDPEASTWWRSAAKPFQAMALVEDGAADHFGLGSEELALACASHSSEPPHLAVVDRFLGLIGADESDLLCGPHPPLSPVVDRELIRTGRAPTPKWSNCSGKHAGMLALARFHGWPTADYVLPDHPVQQRLLRSVSEWTGLVSDAIGRGVDGCTTVCYGVPLSAMARAWAQFGTSTKPAAARLRQAMMTHPFLVAGTGRPCTAMMTAWPGEVLAKIGAEGVYGAALPGLGLGAAVKVEDGDMRASALAVVGVIRALRGRAGLGESDAEAMLLGRWLEPAIVDTRGRPTGDDRLDGGLVFLEGGAGNG